MKTVSREARSEVVEAIRDRYRCAVKAEKEKILNEFVAVSGYHRKHAIRLLSQRKERLVRPALVSKRIYAEAVKSALVIIWEAADRICSKRLKAAIPILVVAMERHGHLRLDAEVRKLVLAISPATIDRLLSSVREGAGSRRRRKRVHRLRREIAIKTRQDWSDPLPGYLEIDFVVHGGGSMSGEYLHSFVATDVCSGWTEAVPLLAREQSLVVEGLKQIGRQMPMPILGIDSDNDSAFLNDTLADYCKAAGIIFTRSRAYHKNDQAWIEQKNGAVIRRIVGHARFSGVIAGQALAQLLQAVRLYVNYFQPSLKLRARLREGSKIKKLYYPPATPCERLVAHPFLEENAREQLRSQLGWLDPVSLLHRIREGQAALTALSNGYPASELKTQDIETFLSRLPTLWESGEVRATHRSTPINRYWRTREDPFDGVWSEILLWLQSDPDSTAKSLLHRLGIKYPGKYQPGQLRTLQRRIKEWRRSMARTLIITGVPERHDIEAISASTFPQTALVGGASLRLATLDSVTHPPPEPSIPIS